MSGAAVICTNVQFRLVNSEDGAISAAAGWLCLFTVGDWRSGNWQEPEGGLECGAGPGVFLHGCWLAEELKTFRSFY